MWCNSKHTLEMNDKGEKFVQELLSNELSRG